MKKLSMVSFAGVDSLDDVKNHTYNELFVSGGFIVSDEFVLNPDFITHGESAEAVINSHCDVWEYAVFFGHPFLLYSWINSTVTGDCVC